MERREKTKGGGVYEELGSGVFSKMKGAVRSMGNLTKYFPNISTC